MRPPVSSGVCSFTTLWRMTTPIVSGAPMTGKSPWRRSAAQCNELVAEIHDRMPIILGFLQRLGFSEGIKPPEDEDDHIRLGSRLREL